MHIQNEHNQIKSDSQDSWKSNSQKYLTLKTNSPSLFQKIIIKYDDQIIQNFIQIQCQKPILNSELFPFCDTEHEQESNLEQTVEEPLQKTPTKVNQQLKYKQHFGPKQSQNFLIPLINEEALFNAFQDEQNQRWVRKKSRNKKNSSQKLSRPLTCPQCFTQICYFYEKSKDIEINKTTTQRNQENSNQSDESKGVTYQSKFVENVIIQEQKVIRNRFIEQEMNKKSFSNLENSSQSVQAGFFQIYQKDLKRRYQNINVKILICCSQCSLDLGFWDANKQLYTLFNVI